MELVQPFNFDDDASYVIGPAANTADYIPQWNGANSKTLKDGLAVPIGGLAGRVTPTVVKTANYTASAGDLVVADISGGSFTITLPTTPADKTSIRIKLIKVATGTRLIIQTGGSGVFNIAGGPTQKILSLLDEAVNLQYQTSGDIWYILAADAPPENFSTNFTGIDATTPISANDISVDTTSRVLTITPPLGYFYYYTDGGGVVNKHIITGTLNFPAFTDTSGIWYFYLDASGNAISTQTKWTSYDTVATVARILWNATLIGSAKITVLSYDSNVNTMPVYTRLWMEKYGTIVNTGGNIADNRLSSGSPNADGRNAVIALTTLSNLYASLPYTITNSTGGLTWQQDLGNTTPASLNATNSALMNIRYQDAGGLSYTLPATRFPFDWNSSTNIPNYITATGTRTPVTDTYFFVYYVYSFQDPRNGEGVRLVSETTQYATINDAEASSWANIQNTFLTLNDPAIRPLYRLIFKYRTTFDVGTKYTVLREVEDLRSARLTISTVTSGSVLASAVVVTPAGNITSTNAQSALEELDLKKLSLDQTSSQTIINGQPIWDTLTASKVVFTDASKKFTSTGIGTSFQFIKGDGSLDSSTYLTSLSGALLATGATTGATSQSQVFTQGITLSNMTSGSVLFADGSGVIAQDNNTFFWDNTNKNLGVGTKTFLSTGNVFQGYGTSTATIQSNVQNASNGNSASSDVVATADSGTNSTNYIDCGINSSTYNDAGYTIGGALSGYLYTNGGDLTIGTQTAAKVIKFHTAGTLAANERMRILADGKVGIGSTSPAYPFVVQNAGGTGTNDIIAFFNKTTNSGSAMIRVAENSATRSIDFEYNSGGTGNFRYGTYADANVVNNDTSGLPYAGMNFVTGGAVQVKIDYVGKVGIGTTVPTNILSLGGNATRTFWMERHTTSNTAGNSLTIQAGGATATATDKDGGMLIEAPGLSTGTGKSSVRLQSLSRAASTATSDNTLQDRFIVPSVKSITAEGSVDLFEIALPAGGMAGGFIQFTIVATDGTELQVHSGHATYAAVNKGGVYTVQITDEPAADDANANSVGAITDTWAITSGTNKVTISVSVACSSITANDIRIYYVLTNGSPRAVTQL